MDKMAGTNKIFEGRARSFSQKMLTSPSVDEDGNEIEFDVREDEEQNVKLQQCVELLVAAGYFRARIKVLSPFDKIVGGMTWCITNCNIDIDIDLLFQENSTIGQKIALTERIVRILPKMKCPHRIEPHQIQGLDFINIYPVIQWLVKRAMETRAEMGDYTRMFSIFQFHKNNVLPSEIEKSQVKSKALTSLKSVKHSYLPQRRYRHHNPVSITDESTRVQITLLEYGRKHGYQSRSNLKETESSDMKKIADSGAKQMDLEEQTDREENAEEERWINSLMLSMSQTTSMKSKLSASTVGQIVGLQSEQIQQIASYYAEKQDKLEQMDKSEGGSGLHQHQRLVASLQKQMQLGQNKLDQLQKDHEVLQQNYKEVYSSLQQVHLEREAVEREFEQVNKIENEENTGVLDTLKSLVSMNESLKMQEKEFKAYCVEERDRLKKMIGGLSEEETTEEDKSQVAAIDKQYNIDRDKLNRVRLLLAKKNREISTLQRKIDDVPTRAELNQYQRRFIELYNQISTKHTETKQFYTLHNTLHDKKLYLNKEVECLNSVYENFTKGMASASSKGEYLKQFQFIIDGLLQNKTKVEKRKQTEKAKRDRLNDDYLQLIEKERLYFKYVKDFTQECRKNEILQSKLRDT